MNSNDIKTVLDKLELTENGRYDNHFYIIDLEDSNTYAKMYTKLDKNAINTENPNFGKTASGSVDKITNYFEVEADGIDYNLFLIADFSKDRYYLKVGQK